MDAGDIQVPSSIVFFLGPCLFVLPDPAARVLRGIDGTDDSELPITIADESIDEEPRLVLFQKNIGVEKGGEIVTRPFVDFLLVWIHLNWKINLGSDDSQIAVRATLCQYAGL